MQTTQNAFVGRITTSADAKNAAFQVKLYATDSTIDIVSTDGDEWTWDIGDVTITQTAVDRFHMKLGTEQLYFLPVDTHGFISKVVQVISDAPVEPHRGWLRRRIEEAQARDGDVAGYDLEVVAGEEEQPSGRRSHIHEWYEGRAAGVTTRRCVGCGQVSIDATGLTSKAMDNELLTI